MDISSSPTAAFVAQHSHHTGSSSHQKNSGHFPQGNNNRGGGHQNRGGFHSGGHGNGGIHRPPRCQICHLEGHYADKCTQRYDRVPPLTSTNLAEAFHAGCNIAPSTSFDWYVDTGASAHMTPNANILNSSTPYTGSDGVIIGIGDSLHVSYSGNYSISNDIKL